MTMEEYAAWAASIAKVTADASEPKMSYLALGLSAEAGEVADVIKKWLRDGKLDRAALIDELGDVAFYWTCLCVAAGQNPADLLAQSRRKIESRLAQR
jgi:NTP pyrophosphatase (non-canonical NTP hydrolase)